MARQAVQHMDGMCLSSNCTRLLRGPGKSRERSCWYPTWMLIHPVPPIFRTAKAPRKAAKKAFPMTRLHTGMRPCPSRSTDLQSFWTLSSRPTNHFHLSWTGRRIFPHQRPIGIPAPNQNVLHALVDSERLRGSHARVEQVPPSSLRRPLPTTAAQPSVELSHTL
jgi:hypothetical protein